MTYSKFQIPNPKPQINSKRQYSITEMISFDSLKSDYWNMFVIWSLGFGASKTYV
jgi:hypothetical protein